MRKFSPSLFALSFFLCSAPCLQAETEPKANLTFDRSENQNSLSAEVKKSENQNTPPTQTTKNKTVSSPQVSEASTNRSVVASNFHPFTGKVSKNKVRLRLQSSYDAPVVRELNRNDLVVVLGETEDFYATQAPIDLRGYVFRTYVLDNVVEGNRVNVRLKPELDAPVISQLNSGDRIDGSIDSKNNKWFEIKLPETTRLYVAKEYIDKAGDVGLKARLDKKRDEANRLFNTTEAMSKIEMQKPFEKIDISGIKANYQHIVADYPEIPETGNKAKEALTSLQDAYTAKKLAYLENQSQLSSSTLENNKKLEAELQSQKSKVVNLEQQLEKSRQFSAIPQPILTASSSQKPTQIPVNMSAWLAVEEHLFNTWAQQTGNHDPKDFYEEQKQQAFVLRGVIEPYTRPVKNRPGDYMLLSSASKLPIAFLYSTHINLQDYIGHEVAILVSPRTNNNFAFPAYFVLSVE